MSENSSPANVTMKYRFSDFCVCPQCYADLIESETSLECSYCHTVYEIRNGIAILLPNYTDDREKNYFETYQQIAEDDLKNPFEPNRAYRYKELLGFMGRRRLRGKRVLDIGPGVGAYLLDIEADFIVVLDIAYAYLEHMPGSEKLARVCGDAERLPFKPGFFDVVSLIGVLEHFLHPEAVVERLYQTCRHDTAIIIEIPWEETLELYQNSQYEFTHLRSFNTYTFRTLWHKFHCKRYKSTYPNLSYPLLFFLEGKIPLALYNALVRGYYFIPGFSQKEYEWRIRLGEDLGKNAFWLRWFTKPVFKMFEMRVGENWFYAALNRIANSIHDRRASHAENSLSDGSIDTSNSK